MLVLCFRIWDSYRQSLRGKGAQSVSDCLKSRKFVLNFVSMVSMICGICSADFQTRAFNCLGGRSDVAGCVVGSFAPATFDFYSFITFDVLANVFFTITKILILQNCLRIVQLGPQHDKRNDTNARILLASTALLCFSSISWILCGFVHHSRAREVFAFISSSEETNLPLNTFFFSDSFSPQSQTQTGNSSLRSAIYMLAAITFVIATLCSFIHIRQIEFHLKRYLQSMLRDEEPCDETNPGVAKLPDDINEPNSIRGFKGEHFRNLRRNLRQLQLAVVLIACSFVVKTLLYILLFYGYATSDQDLADRLSNNITAVACGESNELKTVQEYLRFAHCDFDYTRGGLIIARSLLGSPLVFPLISLFSDPLLMMFVSNPNPTPNRKRISVLAANAAAAAKCNSLFRLVMYLTSGQKNKQKTEAKIDIAGARVVTHKNNNGFASIFDFSRKDSFFNVTSSVPRPPTTPDDGVL
jgi:hypothetical protein